MTHRHYALALLALGLASASLAATADDALHAIVTIALERAIAIPPDSATVRLQYGHTVAMNAVEDFDPYCVFELETVSASPQTVQPGQYQVASIQRRIQDFSGMPLMPMTSVTGAFGGDDGPSQIYYVTEFRLKSDTDRRVRSLRCESNQISIPAPSQHHLSLSEMKSATGDYFDFESVR